MSTTEDLDRTDDPYQRALAARAVGDLPRAERLLTDLLAADPHHEGARFGLAVCRFERGDLAGAAAGFAGVLRDHPGHQLAAHHLALVRARQQAAAPEAAGPPPLRAVAEQSRVADRGPLVRRVRLRARHLLPDALRAAALAAFLVVLPVLLLRAVEVVAAGTRCGVRTCPELRDVLGFLGLPSLRALLVLLAAVGVLRLLVVLLVVIPLRARLIGADLHEYGMEVHTGVWRRTRQFVWYYQITETPTYLRTPFSYLTHTASLLVRYNTTASTTAEVELTGIGSPGAVVEVRDHLQSRIPPERLAVRGAWT